jgi:pimeloyl-ACP methyl ester carboxylesterase
LKLAKNIRSGSLARTEFLAEVGGTPIRYGQMGSGPPTLLIHGLLGGSFCWRFILPALAESSTVYAVDLPGLAAADAIGINSSMSHQAERLLELIRIEGWRDLTIIGSSLGGAIAMLLAGDDRIADRIRAMVLCAPVNPWSQTGQGRIRFLSTTIGGLLLRMALPFSSPCHGVAIRRMYGDPSRVPVDAVDGYRESVLRRGRALNLLSVLRNWNHNVEAVREAIPRIKVPTLLVWGDRDQAVDPASAWDLQKNLAQARLATIAGAGHLPFEETPDEFVRVVGEFLQKEEVRSRR